MFKTDDFENLLGRDDTYDNVINDLLKITRALYD